MGDQVDYSVLTGPYLPPGMREHRPLGKCPRSDRQPHVQRLFVRRDAGHAVARESPLWAPARRRSIFGALVRSWTNHWIPRTWNPHGLLARRWPLPGGTPIGRFSTQIAVLDGLESIRRPLPFLRGERGRTPGSLPSLLMLLNRSSRSFYTVPSDDESRRSRIRTGPSNPFWQPCNRLRNLVGAGRFERPPLHPRRVKESCKSSFFSITCNSMSWRRAVEIYGALLKPEALDSYKSIYTASKIFRRTCLVFSSRFGSAAFPCPPNQALYEWRVTRPQFDERPACVRFRVQPCPFGNLPRAPDVVLFQHDRSYL